MRRKAKCNALSQHKTQENCTAEPPFDVESDDAKEVDKIDSIKYGNGSQFCWLQKGGRETLQGEGLGCYETYKTGNGGGINEWEMERRLLTGRETEWIDINCHCQIHESRKEHMAETETGKEINTDMESQKLQKREAWLILDPIAQSKWNIFITILSTQTYSSFYMEFLRFLTTKNQHVMVFILEV